MKSELHSYTETSTCICSVRQIAVSVTGFKSDMGIVYLHGIVHLLFTSVYTTLCVHVTKNVFI